MKILVDELFPATLAKQLREKGHDAVAVQELPHLRGTPDRDLFDYAQHERRAVVTENVADFLRIDAEYRAAGKEHFGLVLTNNNAFPRGAPNTLGTLVRSIDRLLNEVAQMEVPPSHVIWLQKD